MPRAFLKIPSFKLIIRLFQSPYVHSSCAFTADACQIIGMWSSGLLNFVLPLLKSWQTWWDLIKRLPTHKTGQDCMHIRAWGERMHQVSLHMQMLSPNVSNPHCIPFLKPAAAALSPWPSSSWLLEMHMWKSMPEKSSNLLPLWTWETDTKGSHILVAASGDSVHPLVVVCPSLGMDIWFCRWCC